MKLPFACIAVVVAVLSLGRPAAAVTLTFEDRPETEIEGIGRLSSHGYLFDYAIIVGIVGDGLGRFTENGGKWLASPHTLSTVHGAPFSLLAADVSEFWSTAYRPAFTQSVTFSGLTVSGGALSQTVVLDGLADGTGPIADFQTVRFQGWTNLASVTMSALGPANGASPDFGVDNFVVTSGRGIPEPELWSLMIAGFGLAGARLRRRLRSTA